MAASPQWVPSRFTARAETDSGELILYNSYTGAIGVVPEDDTVVVREALRRQGFHGALDGILKDLEEGGFIVPAGTDELARAAELRAADKTRTGSLQLILMPSETCNFRCVYCYESFQRGKMLPSVREGIRNLVSARARQLDDLQVQWFGGEPTTAIEIIEELSDAFIAMSSEHGFSFDAGITTNAYDLTPQVVDVLLGSRVTRFQVTIDGPAEYHDKRRKLLGGGGTFERIMANLRAMHERPHDERFGVALRVNFDQFSRDVVPELITRFGAEFGGDPRFMTYFRPIGQWGGPHDATLPVCYGKDGEIAMWDLHGEAIRQGLPTALVHRNLSPGGAVCYAAQTFSYIIGTTGRIHKCTVALDDPRNAVGHILPDGTLRLDREKEALWIDGDESGDPACQPCFFRPACQGARCPWIRIKSGETPCPPEKVHIKRVLKLIASAPAADESLVAVDMD